MIASPLGAIDYRESGRGPALVLVPGSCSTGTAWRAVISALGDGFRCITTSLPGYGRTQERRTPGNLSIDLLAEAVEAVVLEAGAPVHLVGHSFGGLVALAVAMRGQVPLESLCILEAPCIALLRGSPADLHHHAAIQAMNAAYAEACRAGEPDAVAHMVDFFGGAGTFAAWPERARSYARETTAVNMRDWQSAHAFAPTAGVLAPVTTPVLVAWGEHSHPALRRANLLLASLCQATSCEIGGASHFMIATHAEAVAELISRHVLDRIRAGQTCLLR